ncbi:MAG: NUDIX domain-containing protein [Desulfovibrionales bacterium]|nr:NUDIX domain-containing protein [Desulfovibrionales bacterium]
MIKYSVECWLYNPLTDRFLLLRCPQTYRHDEYWQPVTGGRGPGEPCIEACLREVQEETGFALVPEQLEVVIPEFTFCIPDARIELHKPVYLARVTTEHVVISPEHIAYYWFDADQVESRLHWDSNRESFRQVLNYSRLPC